MHTPRWMLQKKSASVQQYVIRRWCWRLRSVATNWGGPIDYIDATCGILVEPSSKEGFVKGLTEAMLKLTESPELRQSMGSAGYLRVREHFDWERKVDRMIEIYQQTIDNSSSWPD